MTAKRLGPAVALAIVYLWVFPYYGGLRSANEVPRVLLSQEIAEHGRFTLDARQHELGSRFDIATSPDGHLYSNKAPGISLVGAPVALVHGAVVRAATEADRPSLRFATRVLRLVVVTVPALVFLWWFWGLAARFAGDGAAGDAARKQTLVAYALGSMALPYGLLFFSHAPAAVCAGGAFVAAVRLVRDETARRDGTAAACGLLAGASILVDYQSLIAAAAVGVYLLLKSAPGQRLRPVLIAGGAAALPMSLLLAYHQACYGSPWKTGYSFAADPAHKQGVLGVIGPNREAMWNALAAPDNGLAVLMPWAILALVGIVVVARDPARRARVGAETVVCAVVVAAYVLFVGSLVPEFGRAGWSVGPRYIGVAMPFLAWLAAPGFAACSARPAFRAVAGALLAMGVAIMVIAAVTYPHWPTSFRNPLFEVSLRALGEGLAAPSIGTALGLSPVWAAVPVFAAAAALGAWALGVAGPGARARRWSALVSLVLAGAMMWGFGKFPRTGPGGESRFVYVRRTMLER